MTEPALISTDQLQTDLEALIGLGGSHGQTEAQVAVADATAALMRRYGLQADVIPTAGAPVVIGRRAGRQPFTLLLYHHYDVAPPGPWRAWHHDPFQLAEREGSLYGRGVAAGKGPLVAHLSALSSLIEADGELPCGVVMLAEGEGLNGSPHLGAVLAEHRAFLKADACLSTGGERDAQGRPFCYSGVKGLLQVDLSANGANHMLPPGMAASVSNPLWRLIWALSQIKSDQEEVLIGDFYDDVEGPSRAENQSLRSIAMDEGGRLAAWGLQQFLFGMTGVALVRTETTLPTCNLAMVSVEPAGDLAAIPVAATARLDFQLVPRQRPQAITELLRAHLSNKQLTDITVERLAGGYPAAHTAFEHPFLQQVCALGQGLYGAPLTLLPLGPFAQPLFLFTEAFGIPVAALGYARADSAVNGPNERIPLLDLVRHSQLLIDLLHACAQKPAGS